VKSWLIVDSTLLGILVVKEGCFSYKVVFQSYWGQSFTDFKVSRSSLFSKAGLIYFLIGCGITGDAYAREKALEPQLLKFSS